MRRGALIFVFGLLAGAAAYACVYLACTSSTRQLHRSERPELAWLRQEFGLTQAEFDRVSALHAAYLPQCREMCRQIDAQKARLQQLLEQASTATPEIEAALAESARLRSECQRTMLRHFFQVSQTMAPEQGRRYLEWAVKTTLLRDGADTMQH